jgi:ABC-2 type transport system ATP-binding protein
MTILLSGIYKTFVTSFTRKKIPAVQSVSFEIGKGEIFGIIGPNGAGKSTLLKMLMGFIRADKGEILLAGKNPADPTSRGCVGYLPENPYYYDHLSARELMKFSAAAGGMLSKESGKRIDYLLKRVNLQAAAKRKMRSYSKGMTQRAGLCFALVHDPDILILDEPMSGLDPLGRKMVVDLILDLKKEGKTILFCSHILSDVERICDRMAIMSDGKLHQILHKDDLKLKQDQGNNPLPLESIFLQVIKENAV